MERIGMNKITVIFLLMLCTITLQNNADSGIGPFFGGVAGGALIGTAIGLGISKNKDPRVVYVRTDSNVDEYADPADDDDDDYEYIEYDEDDDNNARNVKSYPDNDDYEDEEYYDDDDEYEYIEYDEDDANNSKTLK